VFVRERERERERERGREREKHRNVFLLQEREDNYSEDDREDYFVPPMGI